MKLFFTHERDRDHSPAKLGYMVGTLAALVTGHSDAQLVDINAEEGAVLIRLESGQHYQLTVTPLTSEVSTTPPAGSGR